MTATEPPSDWKCEECGTPWTRGRDQCQRCGNRTRVPAIEPPSDSFQVIGLTDDDLRRYALETQMLHDPSRQENNPYGRCALCHYTRHPCEVYELATAVLQLLDRGRTDDPWERGGREPVNEYTGLAAEQFLKSLDPPDA